jgi:hypothetical protein
MIIDDVSRKINDKFCAHIYRRSTAGDADCRNWIGRNCVSLCSCRYSRQTLIMLSYRVMTQAILQLSGEPIGDGQERICYRHPADPGKVVKIQKSETRRELKVYRWLQRRNMANFRCLPRFYGQVETNLGGGFVVDLISDYDGTVPESLYWYFTQGYPIKEFLPYLEELRQYLIENMIVFSVDMSRFNVLFNRISNREARLVVIDGLGNHTAINWSDSIPCFARSKIRRRWERFFTKLEYNSATPMEECGGSPRMLGDVRDV